MLLIWIINLHEHINEWIYISLKQQNKKHLWKVYDFMKILFYITSAWFNNQKFYLIFPDSQTQILSLFSHSFSAVN